MDTAGVISDHSTDRAMVMRCRIRSKCQLMLPGGVAEVIKDGAGLHTSGFPLRVDFDDLTHVLGHVENHGDVAALPGQTGAAAARENRCAIPPRDFNGLDHIIAISRD